MDITYIYMWIGFALAAYAVVGNDSIQTLGTFLTSNDDRPWWLLWMFAATILTATLVYGYIAYDGDVSYERLSKYLDPRDKPDFGWYYLLPPLTLMLLTRTGIPVSTSFMILTFFNPKNLMDMVEKSLLGYVAAFVVAIILWFAISRTIEKHFIQTELQPEKQKMWMGLQWLSTGYLWSMWLIQDFANIYVYLPRSLERWELIVSLFILVAMLGYIFYNKGGKIQEIVRVKTNTADVRSATIIDFTFGTILFFFKELNDIPMSTTWVFLGLLAGREIAIRWSLQTEDNVVDFLPDAEGNVQPMRLNRRAWWMVGTDLAKIALGLAISILLVFIMRYLTTGVIAFE